MIGQQIPKFGRSWGGNRPTLGYQGFNWLLFRVRNEAINSVFFLHEACVQRMASSDSDFVQPSAKRARKKRELFQPNDVRKSRATGSRRRVKKNTKKRRKHGNLLSERAIRVLARQRTLKMSTEIQKTNAKVTKLQHQNAVTIKRDRSRMRICSKLGDRNRELSLLVKMQRKTLDAQERMMSKLRHEKKK